MCSKLLSKRGPHYAGQLGKVLAAGLVLLAVSPMAHALGGDENQASDLNQMSLEQLSKVEITTVAKAQETVLKTPAAVYVITQDDIRRSGATSLPEALRLAPGVEVARIDADHWSVAIRGFAGQFSKSLLVLIDGRSAYTPLFSGVYWDAQNVMLDDVDRIEVIRGPGGTIWGANAVNGVINIITKSAKDTNGIDSTLGGGNVDQGTGSLRYGATTSRGFSYRLYSLGAMRGPEYHPDGENFDDWRMGQIGFRTDWTGGSKDSYTVHGDLYRGQSGESVLLATYSPLAEVAEQDKASFAGGNLVARWQHTMGQGSDIQIQAYFDRTVRQDIEVGETRNTFDVDYIQHLRTYASQELTWGLGARLSPSRVIQTSPSVNFLPNKQTDSIYSGFVQYELPFLDDKFTLTAGTKFEHTNFSGYDYQPSVRLLWSPTQRQSAWLAVTRAVRTPSRQDQDVQFNILVQASPPPPVFFEIVGNPKFKPEQLIAYEAGYRWQTSPHFYVDFSTFFNIYNDLEGYGPIGLAILDNPPPVDLAFVLPYANVIEGRSIGAELAPAWDVTPWWRLEGAYSLLHMSLTDKPGFSDVGNLLSSYLGSSPTHVANVESRLRLPSHFEFTQTYRYVSKLPAYGVHVYNTADARLERRVGEGLVFAATGQNLLRPSHPEFGGDPGPLVGIKRSIYFSITWAR
ncbi:MAG TPA: TonB-dependent receptor [Terracidiphilus sp.]|nr:TonB-dependent receptor [Terracidiphilus sp.]